jgi:hypothetical protein
MIYISGFVSQRASLPHRFRSSGEVRPAVRVGLPSNSATELEERYGQAEGDLLTRMLTTGLAITDVRGSGERQDHR